MTRPYIALALIFSLAGCSAIEWDRQRTDQHSQAETAIAATVERTVAAAQADKIAAQATALALSRQITQSAASPPSLATITPGPDAADISSAEVSVYGSVPLDSDRLNIIAALAFDAAGDLLAATRAGDIYRLRDRDADGTADETLRIFADEDEALGQVSGLFTRGESLILLNGGKLSRLQDRDGDGRYETVSQLSEQLPADQNPLLASNSIAQSPDGRLFSANLNSGEILRIILRE